MKHTILISAGGTGGHLYPALAIAEALRLKGWTVIWVGALDKIEARVVPARGFEFIGFSLQSLRNRKGLNQLKSLGRALASLFKMLGLIQSRRPDVVLGMGGFTAGPAGIAAWLTRTPLIVHEQNALAGLTNRWLAKIASQVLTAYPDTLPHGICVGNPVRAEISQISSKSLVPLHQPFKILVLGGSLGARTINRHIPLLKKRLGDRVQIWHQTGETLFAETDTLYSAAGVSPDVIEPFIDNMPKAYEFADCVIARSGAMTVAEVLAVGVPAIFIPYPKAVDDHQYFNAKALVDQGAALLIREADLSLESLVEALTPLLETPSQWESMHQALRKIRPQDAVMRICEICENIKIK